MRTPLDLNLLFIMESLYRTQNVSKTAEEFFMSQSAVSHSIAKLRRHFDDPLFVRVSKGVSTTETAKALRAEIEAFVQKARQLGQPSEKFDPAKATGRITIATTDMLEIVLMPGLIERLKREAPGIQVSIRPTYGQLPKAELENGVYDMAIAGFYKDLPEGFFQTKILESGFSTAYRRGHPTIKGDLTAARFFESDHAIITLQGDFKDSLRATAGGKDRVRKFVFGSYSFTGLAWTVASTDLVLTAPTVLLKKYQEYFPIVVQKSPVPLPDVQIRMIWHLLTHKDPLKTWFREVVKQELKKSPTGGDT